MQYFTSDSRQDQHKLERLLGEMLPTDKETFLSESNRKNKDINEAVPFTEKKSPPVQVIINNTLEQPQSSTPDTVSPIPSVKMETKPAIVKPIYNQWWFGRIIGAIFGGLVLGYLLSRYVGFHFGDTWLGLASLIAAFLLLRNPKRVYLRWAGFCVMAIAGINILSQIDVAFNITNAAEETHPWDFLFKLGFGETPIISLLFAILAVVLFVLDYRMRKEKL